MSLRMKTLKKLDIRRFLINKTDENFGGRQILFKKKT